MFIQSSGEICKKTCPAVLPDLPGGDSHGTAGPEGGKRHAGIHTIWVRNAHNLGKECTKSG